jgi:hypothetical protein
VTRDLLHFSRGAYAAMLRELRERGYRDVAHLEDLVPDDRVVFLRHDIDLDLDRAVRIAEVEASEGMRATYYVLVSTQMYNIAAAPARRALARLADLGHALGLHFDAAQYAQTARSALDAHARRECDILADLSGAPVASISFHRPAPELIGLAEPFAGRPHSYEPRFFSDVGYVSDSSGGFFQGHPLDHPAVAAGRALQLLTHPIWWADDEEVDATTALDRLREERSETLEAVLAAAVAKAKSRAAQAGETIPSRKA